MPLPISAARLLAKVPGPFAVTFAVGLGGLAILAPPGPGTGKPSFLESLDVNRKPVILLSGSSNGSTVRPGRIDSAYRAIGVAGNTMVSNVTIDGLQARVVRDCIRVNGRNIVIRNVHCTMLPPPQRSMHELPEGLHIKFGENVRIEDSSFSGFQMILGPDAYWNGDGVAVERGVSGLSFRNVSSDNNTDAGFDIKSPVQMDGVSASGNCRNFRFWSDADLGTVRVGDVARRGGSSGCAGIWVEGSSDRPPPRIRIRRLIVTASRPLVILKVDKGAADISVDQCVIQQPAGSQLLKMQANVGKAEFGRGCKAD